MLFLKILALEPMNGSAVSQRFILQVSDGSLYPALHKSENEGWITAAGKPPSMASLVIKLKEA